MDQLMSQIMSNVHVKREACVKEENFEQPIDLSWNKFTKHMCDRFVDQEDLRHNSDNDVITRGNIDVCKGHASVSCSDSDTPSYSSIDTDVLSPRQSVLKQEVTSFTKPHPFSIAALLGNHLDDHPSTSSSVPAQITCSYAPQSTSSPYKPLTGLHFFEQLPAVSPVRSATVSEDALWCHACNALCLDYQDGARHQLVHQLRGTKCSLKTAVFSQVGYVTCHKKIGDERLRCGVCDKVVANCFFSKHQRLHDGHFCDVCRQEFSTNSRLQDHMNIHSGRTPFKCLICDRKFAKRASLTQHMRYHRDHKRYPCHYCPKSFNTKYACAVHERLHTGENPFRCEYPGCNQAYPQKIQLKLHVTSHV